MAKEEQLRLQIAELQQQGIGPSEIAKSLGRSRQWVYKWLSRLEAGEENWNKDLPRAPHTVTSRTPKYLEELVVSVRKELVDNPHMEIGAYPIFHALKRRGVEPPSIPTINRILKNNGLVKSKGTYQKHGIDFPETPLNTHIMDLIGPRYLNGGIRFYLLNTISNDTRTAGVYPMLDKSAESITTNVVDFWKEYSLPDFLQMDNELSFKGSNRHPRGLGLLVRTALELGVTPRFIPTKEPWRNGVIERFNQKVENTLLLQEHESFDALKEHASAFMATHNKCHHYSTKGHKNPSQLQEELGVPNNPLPSDYEVRERPCIDCWNKNEIHFIRLVRSDCLISILNTQVEVPSSLMYSYVEAKLLINDHILLITLDGKTVHACEFAMPVV